MKVCCNQDLIQIPLNKKIKNIEKVVGRDKYKRFWINKQINNKAWVLDCLLVLWPIHRTLLRPLNRRDCQKIWFSPAENHQPNTKCWWAPLVGGQVTEKFRGLRGFRAGFKKYPIGSSKTPRKYPTPGFLNSLNFLNSKLSKFFFQHQVQVPRKSYTSTKNPSQVLKY